MMTYHGKRVSQDQSSYLPVLSDVQITRQIEYASKHGYAIGIEDTEDPHPRNPYWEMHGNPMFDLKDPAGIPLEINGCLKTFPSHYVRVTAFDSTQGVESVRMSFIVNRPASEPGFRLVRSEQGGRNIGYSVDSYAVQTHGEGERY